MRSISGIVSRQTINANKYHAEKYGLTIEIASWVKNNALNRKNPFKKINATIKFIIGKNDRECSLLLKYPDTNTNAGMWNI